MHARTHPPRQEMEVFHQSYWAGVSVEDQLADCSNFESSQWCKQHSGLIAQVLIEPLYQNFDVKLFSLLRFSSMDLLFLVWPGTTEAFDFADQTIDCNAQIL
jgi:hypothetical protein